jgi:anti-anti-sigma factor
MNRQSFRPDFGVKVTNAGASGPLIEVWGELDSGTSDEVLEAFRSLETSDGRLTLDLSGVSFVDSAGIRTVIMIEREARRQGTTLTISAPPNEVTELLRTAGVIEHFQLRPGVRHTAVDSTLLLERVELELGLEPQSPARARAEVRELMQGRDHTQTGDVVLLTSEIVTNALVHPTAVSGETIKLRIYTYEDGIRVEVEDSGEGFDPTARVTPNPERGRGLFLVDRFASRWGAEHVEGDQGPGFMVWFELDWRQPRNLDVAGG